MFRKFAGAVNEASRWADKADRNEVARASGEFFISTIKLLFALTHFVENSLKATIGRGLSLPKRRVSRLRQNFEEQDTARRREVLDWNKVDRKRPIKKYTLRR
jgi:hypothetical protein